MEQLIVPVAFGFLWGEATLSTLKLNKIDQLTLFNRLCGAVILVEALAYLVIASPVAKQDIKLFVAALAAAFSMPIVLHVIDDQVQLWSERSLGCYLEVR